MGIIRVIRAGRTCLEIITQDIHPYHTSWPDLEDVDLVWELGWAWSVSYELAGHALRLLHPNGGGICTPTDLGTYNYFIKYWINANTVFYSLHTLCGDKLRIKSLPSRQMDAAAKLWSERRRHMYPKGPGYLQYFIKDWINAYDVSYALHSLCGDKLRVKSPPSCKMDAAAEERFHRRWPMYSDGPGYLQ